MFTEDFKRGINIIGKVRPFIQNVAKTEKYWKARLKTETQENEKEYFKGILHALKEISRDKKRNSWTK